MNSVVYRKDLTIDWVWILHALARVGWAAFFFALGGWVVSIRVQEATLPYKEQAASRYERLERATGGNPAKALAMAKDCLKKSNTVANQAIISNYNPAVPVPKIADVPCPPPAVGTNPH